MRVTNQGNHNFCTWSLYTDHAYSVQHIHVRPTGNLFSHHFTLSYLQTPSKLCDDDAWKEKVASFYGSMDEMNRADGRDMWLYLVKACKKFPGGRRWTSKSTGPQSHRFFRPGVTCKKNHIRGKDFFDGYDELKSFIVREMRGMFALSMRLQDLLFM